MMDGDEDDLDELQQLVQAVDALLGKEAVLAAGHRAYDVAVPMLHADANAWLRVYAEAYKDELRRLLRPH